MKSITIYHSPDADDAFMFYGLACGAIRDEKFEFRHELKDIESLNHLACRRELEVTAVSVHAYAYLADAYSILPCGASMGGEDYGPCVVTKGSTKIPKDPWKVAVPGELTSAVLAMRLWARESGVAVIEYPMHFEEIMSAVSEGAIDAGLIIHEGQITHQRDGFREVLNLGAWWWNRHGLPLPLGVNIVKRDLGAEACQAVGRVLRGSIEYALSHRTEALEYALSYGRGITAQEADRFVAMYVNDWTLDLGANGRQSIELFLSQAVDQGLLNSEHCLSKLQFVSLQ